MPLPTDTVLTAGSIIRVQRGVGNRTLPIGTITVGTAVAANGTSIGITAIGTTFFGANYKRTLVTGSVVVQEGDTLTFNETTPVTVKLSADLKVGDTSISIAPAPAAITVGKIATTNGYFYVLGGDSLEFNITDNEVSTRGFENGLFDDARKVMIGGDLPFTGIYRRGDPCFANIIKPCATSDEEMAFYYQLPDGQFTSGWAFVKGYKESNKLDDILRYNFSFRAVGRFTTGTVTGNAVVTYPTILN
jgi:hypothetical protein